MLSGLHERACVTAAPRALPEHAPCLPSDVCKRARCGRLCGNHVPSCRNHRRVSPSLSLSLSLSLSSSLCLACRRAVCGIRREGRHGLGLAQAGTHPSSVPSRPRLPRAVARACPLCLLHFACCSSCHVGGCDLRVRRALPSACHACLSCSCDRRMAQGTDGRDCAAALDARGRTLFLDQPPGPPRPPPALMVARSCSLCGRCRLQFAHARVCTRTRSRTCCWSRSSALLLPRASTSPLTATWGEEAAQARTVGEAGRRVGKTRRMAALPRSPRLRHTCWVGGPVGFGVPGRENQCARASPLGWLGSGSGSWSGSGSGRVYGRRRQGVGRRSSTLVVMLVLPPPPVEPAPPAEPARRGFPPPPPLSCEFRWEERVGAGPGKGPAEGAGAGGVESRFSCPAN